MKEPALPLNQLVFQLPVFPSSRGLTMTVTLAAVVHKFQQHNQRIKESSVWTSA